MTQIRLNAAELASARYAWVLARKSELNANTFTLASMYGAGLSALGATQGFVAVQLCDGKMTYVSATLASNYLLIALYGVTALFLLLQLANIISWWGYRVEECSLEAKAGISMARQPSIKAAWKWYETHLMIAVILFAVAATGMQRSYLPQMLNGRCVAGSL